MTTFAAKTFNAVSYAAFRPSYPPHLYNTVLKYHRGPKKLCLDLGCGHGLVAQALSPHFEKVLATDPSKNMIAKAQEEGQASGLSNTEYKATTAEDLSFLADGSVDLVVAGQAAHWFDFGKAWPELGRVVRGGGALAFWTYKDPIVVGYPRASETLLRYMYGENRDEALGAYWEEPGRSILRRMYADIKPPRETWVDEERITYEPDMEKKRGGKGTVFVEKTVTLQGFMEHVRTFSSFHNWQEAHPEQKPRKNGGDGDLVDRLLDDIKKGEGWKDEEMKLDLEWGSALLMVRKKE